MRWVRVSTAGRDTGTPDPKAFLFRSPGFNSPFFVPPSSFFWLRLALSLIPGESKNRRLKRNQERTAGIRARRFAHSRLIDPSLGRRAFLQGQKKAARRRVGRRAACSRRGRLRLLADLELDRVGRVRRE